MSKPLPRAVLSVYGLFSVPEVYISTIFSPSALLYIICSHFWDILMLLD